MKRLYLFLIFSSCFTLLSDSVYSLNFKSRSEPEKTDCFAINTTGLSIKGSSCGSKNGAINGLIIDGDGKFTFTWRDIIGNTVGNNLNLTNVLDGTYTLEVKGPEDCPKQTFTIAIDEINGIESDLTNIKLIPAGCDNKGSILGIKITGASRVEWRSFSTQTIVSTTENLENMPVGVYKVTGYNNSGCIKDLGPFTISSQTVLPLVEKIDIIDPTCGQASGDVNITLNVLPNQETLNFFVYDLANQIAQSGLIAYNSLSNPVLKSMKLAPGSYRMFVEGKAGCDILLTTFNVSQNVLTLVSDSIGVVNDQCDQHIGRILGIKLKGMTKPPKGRIFEWTDSKGKPVGTNFPFLLNIGAGKYTLHVIDPGGCELTETFTVLNEAPDLVPPKLSDINVCLPGNVALFVENTNTTGSYRLYDTSAESPFFIAESKDGKFTVSVTGVTNFYVSYLQGICESPKTLVTVNVAAPGIKIPNTFTPNGDGINDNWNITALENYPGTTIDIYNRYGTIVYHSLNYTNPFDGRKDGKELPAGAYFYKIEISRISCEGQIRGSLTIIR